MRYHLSVGFIPLGTGVLFANVLPVLVSGSFSSPSVIVSGFFEVALDPFVVVLCN